MVIDRRQHVLALREALVIDAARQVQVAHAEISVGRIRAEAEGAVSGAEISRPRVWIGLGWNADIRRHVLPRAEFLADDAAEAGELDRRAGAVAGEHVVRAALVGGFAMRERANNGD